MALDGRDNKSLGLLTPYILQIQMLHNQRDSHDKDNNNNKAKGFPFCLKHSTLQRCHSLSFLYKQDS